MSGSGVGIYHIGTHSFTATTMTLTCFDVSASAPDSVPDWEHFRQSGDAQRILKEVTIGGDAGY